ncbi:MAG: Na+/H+ antiporter subunit C [Alphaproteobacteria bacterium]|nr:Na+/H+ antiporter subunit C [Alphaproteobacteria bacterium]
MDPLQFIIDRYNYWIFIVLMMIGLYTVIARGNLIKKIIGLNIFQTSVFIYYISIGKITGGTAPIYTTAHQEKLFGHGESHERESHDGEGHGGGHGDQSHGPEAAGHESDDGHGEDASTDHAAEPLHAGASNDAAALTAGAGEAPHGAPGDIHAGAPNPPDALTGGDPATTEALGLTINPDLVEPIYSNPLPHVLILTAIVVGVATTAVGLALAVRIREAYGTIEEDELEDADNIAEFGVADPRDREPPPGGKGERPDGPPRGAKLAGDRLSTRLGRGGAS